MKYFFPVFLLAVIINISACKQSPPSADKEHHHSEIPKFDSLKAKAYGADDYGMKTYVMAFLYKGENRSTNPDTTAKMQRAHMDNIKRLSEEGKLVMAGPFLDSKDLRGIYIFDVSDTVEAAALTRTDPAIQSGWLTRKLKPWYGSAAIKELSTIHKTIAKESI
ncbi:YciI family protein [Luteibaculum oceani]|uniref:YCII-related domain-containing protein n=1 Tax=Luteibaculum oceani TaxID=1294296 RepID=A0A5C6USN3_9FLAO|nr:YciI family protein [Luteibaculum oceani]TXC75241.1 hypothetical protein FRX97_12020 [Luteibaculum oceani]